MDMIARISKNLPLILLLFCGLPSETFAFPILEHDHSQPTLISFDYSASEYNADTDIFTARLIDPYGQVPDLGYVDLSGVLDLSLMVDETGALFGGTVSWVGGSPDFGIADGTLLFSGTVADFAYGLDSAPQFHVLIDIDYSVAQLGFGSQAGLILFHSPDSILPPSEWLKTSFEGDPYTHDELISIAAAVPEPAVLLLFGTGMFWLLLVSVLRQPKTN